MSDQYLAEIRPFAFNFAPLGWAACNGQTLNISQYSALFSVIGTSFGGDGVNTFQLPNLQGRFPVDAGQGTGLSPYVVGMTGGSAAVTLNTQEIPSHTHPMAAINTTTGLVATPTNNFLADITGRTSPNIYGSDATTAQMSAKEVSTSGGSQPHNNLSPYVAVNFCIALEGIYPTRS